MVDISDVTYLGKRKSSLESTAVVRINKEVLILTILRASDLKECTSKCTFRKLSRIKNLQQLHCLGSEFSL